MTLWWGKTSSLPQSHEEQRRREKPKLISKDFQQVTKKTQRTQRSRAETYLFCNLCNFSLLRFISSLNRIIASRSNSALSDSFGSNSLVCSNIGLLTNDSIKSLRCERHLQSFVSRLFSYRCREEEACCAGSGNARFSLRRRLRVRISRSTHRLVLTPGQRWPDLHSSTGDQAILNLYRSRLQI